MNNIEYEVKKALAEQLKLPLKKVLKMQLDEIMILVESLPKK